MSDHDLITIPDPSPAGRYTRELATRVNALLGLQQLGLADAQVQAILSAALHMARRDILAGRFVNLEHIGEFVAVDNHGPEIRYSADRRLLQGCSIHNLKQAGGN